MEKLFLGQASFKNSLNQWSHVTKLILAEDEKKAREKMELWMKENIKQDCLIVIDFPL